MLSSLCLSILITSVIATPLSTPHDISGERSPLALAPFHTLQAEHAHEEDPLPAGGPTGISQVYNGHMKGYAGRFTDAVIQRIREMPEVAYVEQDSIVHVLDTQHLAPWVRSSILLLSRDL